MKQPTVPPSLDRIAHKRRLFSIAGVAILIAVGLGAILLFSGSPSTLKELEALDLHQSRQEQQQEQGEFSRAYAATQAFVLQQVNLAGIQQLNWRNTRHEGHNGYYRIEGIVEFTYEEGETYSMFYHVTTVWKNNVWQVSIQQFKRVPAS